MKKIRTYWWFWGLIPLFLFYSFVCQDSILDIPNETWNTIFPLNYYGIPLSLFLFLSGLGYFFQAKKLNIKLSWIHFISSVTGLFILTLPKIINLSDPPRRYYSSTIEPTFSEFLIEMNLLTLVAFLLIIFGVIVYFINLGIAIFKIKT
ncbi:MAG: hypothetical protein ACPGVD_07505 [Flavobacteriales bacterium]